MRTTIVIPNTLHRSIERFLAQTDFSKSVFFLHAAKQFIKQRANAKTLEALNKVYSENPASGKDDTYKLVLRAMARKGPGE
ncbi:MAG: hypothetical protein AAB354_03635 [candidate division KSB1 bacterium]